MKKNVPNLFLRETIFPIILKEKSTVTIELFDEEGVQLLTILQKQELFKGKHEIKFNGNQLRSKIYLAKITIENQGNILIENRNIKIN